MRVTVCELPADMARLVEAWDGLVGHCTEAETDLLLLPEMPFAPWLAATKEVDEGRWLAAILNHDKWHARLGEAGATTVLGSAPVVLDGRRHNQAFVWESGLLRPAHVKYYLPDEDGFWEATWYERGQPEFVTADSAVGRIGFLVCTEVWFTEHARGYARDAVTLIATPRATEWTTRDRWLAAGRVAAIMAGAFSLSSNRSGTDGNGQEWGGFGWVIDPSGELLGSTSTDEPWVTVEIDPFDAERAKVTYPRYVEE